MSVINTMLKDLERRGADGEVPGDNILGGLSSGEKRHQDNGPSSKVYLFSLIVVIGVIAIVIGGYFMSPYKLVTAVNSKQSAQVDVINNKPRPQHANSEPAVSESAVSKMAVADTVLAAQAKVVSDKTAPIETRSVQSQEAALTSQKASLQTSAPVAAEAASKVSGAVKRDVPAITSQKKTVTHAAVNNTAESESAHQVAGNDATETTAESLRVVTKQQRAFTPAEQSRQAYATAVTMYGQGRKQEAKSSLTQSLALDPSNADACRLLTVIYLDDGRADLAAETVEGGLKLHEKDQNLLRLYVQALVKQKKYSEAISVMARRVELSSPADLGYLAGLYQKNNDHLEAVKYYAQALQLVPSKSVWWLGQGISLEILQQYKEAIQSYQKSVSTGGLSTNLMEYAINRINVIKQHHPDLKS